MKLFIKTLLDYEAGYILGNSYENIPLQVVGS